jgi:hypothetical protein
MLAVLFVIALVAWVADQTLRDAREIWRREMVARLTARSARRPPET